MIGISDHGVLDILCLFKLLYPVWYRGCALGDKSTSTNLACIIVMGVFWVFSDQELHRGSVCYEVMYQGPPIHEGFLQMIRDFHVGGCGF